MIAPQRPEVARGLDRPGEVDDRVGAAEVGDEVVARDVGARRLRLRELALRQPAREPEHGVDRGLVGERGEHARPDVPGRSDDDDSHATGAMSSSATSVKNAFANGECPVRARTSSQSICSRSDRATSSTLS